MGKRKNKEKQQVQPKKTSIIDKLKFMQGTKDPREVNSKGQDKDK